MARKRQCILLNNKMVEPAYYMERYAPNVRKTLKLRRILVSRFYGTKKRNKEGGRGDESDMSSVML